MSKRTDGACLVCGKPLIYKKTEEPMECVFCHKIFMSYACCEDGHYVCDDCHEAEGIHSIEEYCMQSSSRNPITMVQEMMQNPYIYMHGPEHHVMVGSAIITAYHNAGGEIKLEEALAEMKKRGSKYPGGSCGFWGACGAAVSIGMSVSILTGSTPLAGKSWGLCNQATANSLDAIGKIGGPRCCKRNSFTAILKAVEFIRENLGVDMELPETVTCEFSEENKQCLKQRCPYYR